MTVNSLSITKKNVELIKKLHGMLNLTGLMMKRQIMILNLVDTSPKELLVILMDTYTILKAKRKTGMEIGTVMELLDLEADYPKAHTNLNYMEEKTNVIIANLMLDTEEMEVITDHVPKKDSLKNMSHNTFQKKS